MPHWRDSSLLTLLAGRLAWPVAWRDTRRGGQARRHRTGARSCGRPMARHVHAVTRAAAGNRRQPWVGPIEHPDQRDAGERRE